MTIGDRIRSIVLPTCCGVVLAVGLATTLYRLSLETSFWIDESYSVLLSTFPATKVVALTSVDANPPLYYLALKAWLKLGRGVGIEGVLWARLLNLLPWSGLAALVWWQGRKRLSWQPTLVLLALVGTTPFLLLGVRDVRGYGVANVALFLVFWLWWNYWAEWRESRTVSRRRTLATGAAIAVLGAAAVWTHLLSAAFLASFALVSLLLVLGGRRDSWRALLPLLGGLATAAVSFLPWLGAVVRQVDYVSSSSPAWMTPPSLANLLAVFAFWFPAGRLGLPLDSGNGPFLIGGVVGLLVVGVSVLWHLSVRPQARRDQILADGALLGLGSSTLFVVVLWGLARLGLAPVFHGERYPGLAAAVFAAGLFFLVAWGTSHRGSRTNAVLVALAPLLVVQCGSQVALAQRESHWGLSYWKSVSPEAFPQSGSPVYVFPSELLPYYRQTLAPYDVHRIEELPCDVHGEAEVAVLDVNSWPILDRPRDYLVRAALKDGLLGRLLDERHFPPETDQHVIYRLKGKASPLTDELCSRALAPKRLSHAENPGLVAQLLPEEQLPGREWSYLETTDDLELFRWSQTAATYLQLPGRLPAGSYRLVLRGHRASFPSEQLPLEVVAGAQHLKSLPIAPGLFEISLPLTVGDEDIREITVLHPTWRPSDISGSSDARTLSFGFRGLWLIQRSP